MGSTVAPRNKSGAVLDIEAWTLEKLIDVATDLNVLAKEREQVIDTALRRYRNLIHPRAETRKGYGCGDAEGWLAIGALAAVCDALS